MTKPFESALLRDALREQVRVLVNAVAHAGQYIAWHEFGECRGFDAAIATPEQVIQMVRAALAAVGEPADHIERALEMIPWQPIETAPKETELLVGRHVNGEWRICQSGLYFEPQNEFDGDGGYWFWHCDWDNGSITDEAPTHWMPLPTPPSEPATANCDVHCVDSEWRGACACAAGAFAFRHKESHEIRYALNNDHNEADWEDVRIVAVTSSETADKMKGASDATSFP